MADSMLIKVEDMPAIVATLSHKFKEITVEEPLKIFTLCICTSVMRQPITIWERRGA